VNTKPIFFAAVIALAVIPAYGAFSQAEASQAPRDPAKEAGEILDMAQALYDSGAYEQCRETVSKAIGDFESGAKPYQSSSMARLYVLNALLAFTFREEANEEELKKKVDQDLWKGLELDLNLTLGDPATIPRFVQDRFTAVRESYLAQFSRTSRRNTVLLFGALVLDPTIFQNMSLLQPGLGYSLNLSEAFTLEFDLRFPLQLPIWNSIRGQVGLIWYPTFQIERIVTGLSFFSVFGLDNLDTYTLSLAVGGRVEYLTRLGFGVIANAELFRVDLIMGPGNPLQPTTYNTTPLGFFRIVFANFTVYLTYVF
jgi:hypothetical protein